MAGPAELKKQEIVAALASARARISAAGEALHQSLDMPARAAESFQRRRTVWLSGAALVGFVLSKLPAREKTVFIEKATGKLLGAAAKLGPVGKLGTLFSAAKIAINLARPLLSEVSGRSVAEFLKRFRRPAKSGAPAEPEKPPKPGRKV